MGEKSQYITFDQIKLLVSKVEIIGVWQNLKLNSVMFCRPHHLTSGQWVSLCQLLVSEFVSVSLCDYQAIVWLSSIGVSVQCLCDCQEFVWVFSVCVIVQSSESEFVWVVSAVSGIVGKRGAYLWWCGAAARWESWDSAPLEIHFNCEKIDLWFSLDVLQIPSWNTFANIH